MEDKETKRRKHEEVQRIKKDLINFAKTIWGKKWIHSILDIGRPYRMQRGILYAEDKERIDNLIIKKGQIFAMVQGTAPTPYRVKVNFELIPEKSWKIIIEELGNEAINIINLLGGELPEVILEIFENEKFPLFIDAQKGLDATCSCPDQAIPCKHIAATILYIARVLDYDPFILLELRGKTKENILKELSLAKFSEEYIITNVEEKKAEFSFNIPRISINQLQINKLSEVESQPIGFKFKRSRKVLETLENLGLPKNLERPEAFATVLNSIYHFISAYIYDMATQLEKIQRRRK